LNNIVPACSQAITRREELFKRLTEVDLVGSTNKVPDPKLILNSLFLTKQQFNEQVDIFRGLSIEKFYGIIEYDENAIDNWLVDYSVKIRISKKYYMEFPLITETWRASCSIIKSCINQHGTYENLHHRMVQKGYR
jgi:hypothetical protein